MRSLRKRTPKSYKLPADDSAESDVDNVNEKEIVMADVTSAVKLPPKPVRKGASKKARADSDSDESDVYQEKDHEATSSEEEDIPDDAGVIIKVFEGSDAGSDQMEESDAESVLSVHCADGTEEPVEEISPELLMMRQQFQEQIDHLVADCFQSMLTLVKYTPVKSTRRGRGGSKKQESRVEHDPIETECIKTELVDDEGRFECPIIGCDKVFKTIPSIKYHANTFSHSLLGFLAAIKRELEQKEASPPFKEQLLKCLMDFKIPNNLNAMFDVLSPLSPIFILESGAPCVTKVQFLFGIDCVEDMSVTDLSEFLPADSNVSKMNEHQKLLYELVNDALACLLVSAPKKPIARNGGKFTKFLKDGLQQVFQFAPVTTDDGEGKYECCLPGCSKAFKAQPSIKYHFEKASHDLESFLKHCLLDETVDSTLFAGLRQNYQNIKDVISLRAVIEKGTVNDRVTSHEFLYQWPGLDGTYYSSLNFMDGDANFTDGDASKSRKDLPKKLMNSLHINGPFGYNFNTTSTPSSPVVCLQQIIIRKDALRMIISEEEHASYLDLRRKLKIEHRGKPDLPNYEVSSTEVKDIAAISGRPGFLMFTGGYVNAFDWADYVVDDQFQYFAVGSSRDPAPLIWGQQHDGKGTIQIWSTKFSDRPEYSAPELKLVICHDNGAAIDLKWCPRGGFVSLSDSSQYSRLGLIAVTFSSGLFCIYAIPNPNEIQDSNNSMPYYVHLDPLYSTQYEEGGRRNGNGVFTKISWSKSNNCTLIATGCSSGTVMIWSINDLVTKKLMRPCAIMKIHDFNVCALEWHNRDKFTLISTGSDGKTCFTDIREYMAGGMQLSRTFEFTYAATSRKQSIYFSNADFTMKEVITGDDLYRGVNVSSGTNVALCASVSNYHEFLATSSSSGEVKITNVNICKIRGQHGIMVHLFNLKKDERDESDSFIFSEHVKNETLITKNNKTRIAFGSTDCALVHVQWNPIETASTWIMTASRCGLIRVECTKSKK